MSTLRATNATTAFVADDRGYLIDRRSVKISRSSEPVSQVLSRGTAHLSRQSARISPRRRDGPKRSTRATPGAPFRGGHEDDSDFCNTRHHAASLSICKNMSSRPSVHPSAEEFLRQLILFIDSRGSELLSSKAAFKLQPRALEYVAQRLEGLRQLQRIKTSNPIRFLAGAVADLTDFLRMEKVQQFCSLVQHLKLYSSAQDRRDPTPVDFTPFKSVSTMEIRGCDLSSVCPRGVECVRSTVECLVCQDSLECLWHLLEPSRVAEGDSRGSHRRWAKLSRLSCLHNDLREIDASIRLAPDLEIADFSRNQILQAQNLSNLPNLVALDLSFNQLRKLGEIPLCTGLRRLFLQSNGIRSLDGVERLERLEELDMRWNLLSSLGEVVKLKTLSSLRLVSLSGNPISASANYRINVLACLLEWRDDVTLDARPPTDVEKKKARRLVVSRDGSVEVNPTESSVTTVPTPSSIWGLFSPIFRQFRSRRHQFASSRSAESPRPSLDDEPLTSPPPRPVKRIVDLPDASFTAPRDTKIAVIDARSIPRTSLTRGHSQSLDLSHFNGSYDDRRYGAVSLA